MGKQLTELYAENQRKSEHIQKVENLLKKYETESSSQSSLQGSQNSITNPNEMNGNESKINGHGVENQNQNLDENSDERVSDLESELNVEWNECNFLLWCWWTIKRIWKRFPTHDC